MSDADVVLPDVLKIDEAAAMLRISPAFARKLASEGKLPGVLPRLGKEWRVNREALEGYIRRPVAQPSARSDHAWNEVHTARESRNDARASDRA